MQLLFCVLIDRERELESLSHLAPANRYAQSWSSCVLVRFCAQLCLPLASRLFELLFFLGNRYSATINTYRTYRCWVVHSTLTSCAVGILTLHHVTVHFFVVLLKFATLFGPLGLIHSKPVCFCNQRSPSPLIILTAHTRKNAS